MADQHSPDQTDVSPHPAYLPLREKPTPQDAPRRYRKITAGERDRVLEMHGQGLGIARIGKLLDRDPAIVRRILNQKGVATPKLQWNAPEAMKLLGEGMPVEEVSRIVDKPIRAIRQYATRHGFRSD